MYAEQPMNRFTYTDDLPRVNTRSRVRDNIVNTGCMQALAWAVYV